MMKLAVMQKGYSKMPVLDAREHGKLIRQFLKAAREIQEIGLIGDIEYQTLSEIQSRLIKISSPGAGYKQAYPRHGSPWKKLKYSALLNWLVLIVSMSGSLPVNTSGGRSLSLNT